jgi:hypothetical protein
MKAIWADNTCLRKFLLFFWVVAAGLVFPLTVWSQTTDPETPVRLSASIDKKTAHVGDLLWLTLIYELPEGARLTETTAIQGLDPLTIVQQVMAPNKIKLRFLIDQLQSFDLGPIVLPFIDEQGNEQEMTAEPIPLTVLSNLGDKPEEATLRPIQGIMPIQPRWLIYLSVALAAILLLGIIGGIFWWRKKRAIMDIRAISKDPPHIRAEKEIEALLASGLFEQGDVKGFYFSFSETIRRYMESLRKFPAAEMTTEEIARFVKTEPLDQKILPMLRQADIVKFADSIPAPDDKEEDIRTARMYIQKTRPTTPDLQEEQSGQEEVRP